MENDFSLVSAEARLLLEALRQQAKPVPFATLMTRLKNISDAPPKKLAQDLLTELVQQGYVRQDNGKKPVYWLPEWEPAAQERICGALTGAPRARSVLEKDLAQWLRDWPKATRLLLLEQLIQTGHIQNWPAITGKKTLLGLPTADPQLYLQAPLQKFNKALTDLAKKLAPFGVTQEQLQGVAAKLWQEQFPAVTVPPPAPDYAQLILDGLPKIESAALTGALVSLTRLRKLLASEIPDKFTFDQVVLQLAREERVVLHRHDYVASLSPAERDDLVVDERDNHFIGIALNL